MAEYNFGQQILSAIQLGDELNMRKQQMNLEEARFQQQTAQANRQFGLAMLNADARMQNYQNEAMYRQQELTDRQSTMQETARNHVITNFTNMANLSKDTIAKLPKGIGINVPENLVNPELPQGTYVPNSVLKNLDTEAKMINDTKKTNAVVQNAGTNAEKLKLEKEKVTSDAQTTYDNVMNAPLLSAKELHDQGLMKNYFDISTGKPRTDSAYVYTGKNGVKRVFSSKKELANFATSLSPKAPKKWTGDNNTDTPSTIPQQAIDYLKQHPNTKNEFENHYGKGSSTKYLK